MGRAGGMATTTATSGVAFARCFGSTSSRTSRSNQSRVCDTRQAPVRELFYRRICEALGLCKNGGEKHS
jgi:hypothetical protein